MDTVELGAELPLAAVLLPQNTVFGCAELLKLPVLRLRSVCRHLEVKIA